MELISILANILLIGAAILIVVLLISYVSSKASHSSHSEEYYDPIPNIPQQKYNYQQPRNNYDNGYAHSTDYLYNNREINYTYSNQNSNNGHRRRGSQPIEKYEVNGIRVTHITYGMDMDIERKRPGIPSRRREEYLEPKRNDESRYDNFYPSREEYSRYEENEEENFLPEVKSSRYEKTESQLAEKKSDGHSKRYTIVNKPVITNISESSSKPIHLMSTREFLKASFK
ncbi:MAG: hypothetical protein V1720_13870 [bacterium]